MRDASAENLVWTVGEQRRYGAAMLGTDREVDMKAPVDPETALQHLIATARPLPSASRNLPPDPELALSMLLDDVAARS